jgi:hypothetical protein
MYFTQGVRETSTTLFSTGFLRLALAKFNSGWQSGDSMHPLTCTCFRVYATGTNRHANSKKTKIVRPKSSRHPTWRKGAWNFLVERFLLNTRFPAACYDTAEENNKKLSNKEIVRPQTSRRPFRQVGRLEAFCRTMSSGCSVASVCRLFLGLQLYTVHGQDLQDK